MWLRELRYNGWSEKQRKRRAVAAATTTTMTTTTTTTTRDELLRVVRPQCWRIEQVVRPRLRCLCPSIAGILSIQRQRRGDGPLHLVVLKHDFVMPGRCAVRKHAHIRDSERTWKRASGRRAVAIKCCVSPCYRQARTTHHLRVRLGLSQLDCGGARRGESSRGGVLVRWLAAVTA